MLKYDVTYEDFNGDEVTETLYFNLSTTELFELQEGYEGGLEDALMKIIKEENIVLIAKEIKRILLAAYGVRSEDGKRFIKSDEIREQFAQTAAFDAVFFKVATDENEAASFIPSLMPKTLSKQLDKAMAEGKLPDGTPLPTVPQPAEPPQKPTT